MNAVAPELVQERAPSERDRWVPLLGVTAALNLVSFVLFPMFVTDALTPMLSLLCGVPALWGFYSFLFFRTRRERIVGYVAIVPAALWLFGALSLLWEYGWTRH
jgi:hypothetical protein